MTRLAFEALCEQRRDAFGGEEHRELAISYPRDRLVFLGLSVAQHRLYLPHMLYARLGSLDSCVFEQPLWWHVTRCGQVREMMKDLELLLTAQLSKARYLAKWLPANTHTQALLPSSDTLMAGRGLPLTNIQQDSLLANPSFVAFTEEALLDFEGWVAMKTAAFPELEPALCAASAVLGLPCTVYSKVKSVAYYKGHKFHYENIPFLLKLAETSAEVFPLARKVAKLFNPGVMSAGLLRAGALIRAELDFKDSQNVLLSQMSTAYDLAVTRAQERKAKPPKNPLKGFEQRPYKVQCRIVMSHRGVDTDALLIPIYRASFPDLNALEPELGTTLRALTMQLLPWEEGYEERTRNLKPTSKCVQKLIYALIGDVVL